MSRAPGDLDDAEDLDVDGVGARPWWRAAVPWAGSAAGAVALFLGMFLLNGWLRAPSLPERAPGFSLPDLDGRPVALEQLRGRTVVLNFWATWCGPCRAEAPAFAAFARAHPEVTVLGIAADGPPARVRATARALGIDYPILMGDPATLRAYGVDTFPTTVVVGPDGTVRSAWAGVMLRPQLAWAAGAWW